MPSARAPAMSSSGESPTIAASSAADADRGERSLEDRRVGLRPAVGAGAERNIHVETVVRCELLEVSLAVRDEPDPEPATPNLFQRGQRVLVEREVVVPLPRAARSRRRRP